MATELLKNGLLHQHGSPPHSVPPAAKPGSPKEPRPCGTPMVLPAEAGIKAGRSMLWCPKCNSLILAEEREIDLARAVAKENGFKRGAIPLRPLVGKAPRQRHDPASAALELFPQHPEYHRVPKKAKQRRRRV